MISLRDWIRHPTTKALAVVGVFGGLLKLPLLAALWAALWANLGTLFPAISITAWTIAPEVPEIPTEPVQVVALGLGGLFVAKMLSKVARNAYDRIINSTDNS